MTDETKACPKLAEGMNTALVWSKTIRLMSYNIEKLWQVVNWGYGQISILDRLVFCMQYVERTHYWQGLR